MSGDLQLIGHADAVAQFEHAKASGHLHHAWILKGPSGIGKSLLAKRLAADMLGADLSQPQNTVSRKVISGSHPDLSWVTLEANEKGKLRQDITVDQIRSLNRFFSLKAALAGWRVGVIDALDTMNTSGLNALLKTLEEPPERSILFLIYHGEKILLPTIRSRCQVLKLNPLSDDETAQVLDQKRGIDSAVLGLAKGRPGRAIALSEAGVAPVIQATRDALRNLDKTNHSSLPDALGRAAHSTAALKTYTQILLDWCALEAGDQPVFASAWLKLQNTAATAEALNLTPLQTAGKLWAVLQSHHRALSAA